MEKSPAGDSTSYSDDWAAIAQEEQGQAAAPPESEGHDRAGAEEQDSGQPRADEDGERQGPDADQQPPAGSETDDIWANADPQLRAAFEAEKDRAARAENTLRSNNARWSQAQREINQLRARSQPAPTPGTPAPGNERAPDQSTAELDEQLKQVAEEYPDIAKPLIDVIAGLRSQVEELRSDSSRRAEFEQTQAGLAEQERLAAEEQALAEDHPDWSEVVLGQDFADWAIAQPRMVQEALARNGNGIVDGREASKILSDFKRDTGSPAASPALAQKRGRQLEGARHVPGRQGALPGEGRGGTYSDEWKRLANEERRREGARR